MQFLTDPISKHSEMINISCKSGSTLFETKNAVNITVTKCIHTEDKVFHKHR